jgi:hypothetical protein
MFESHITRKYSTLIWEFNRHNESRKNIKSKTSNHATEMPYVYDISLLYIVYYSSIYIYIYIYIYIVSKNELHTNDACIDVYNQIIEALQEINTRQRHIHITINPG